MNGGDSNDNDRVRRFNLACAVVALLFLLATLGAKYSWRPSEQDFTQFYMGGLIARAGAWDALYPDPLPGSPHNPGDAPDSTLKPKAAALAKRYGVPEGTRFIQPPAAALLLMPLALLSHGAARASWCLISILATWGIALQAGRVYEACRESLSRGSGLVTLLIAASPLAHRWVRTQNFSAIMGLLIGWSVLELLRPRDRARGGVALALGMVSKYATAALLPLFAAMGRWRAVAGFLVSSAVILGATVAVAGVGPFSDYARHVAPLLGRSVTVTSNQSVEATLLRLTHREAPPPGVAVALDVARLVVLVVVLGLIIRRPRGFWDQPVHACAAAMALLLWMLIFSPMFWDHYQAYVAPLWGWLIWEAARGRARAAWVTVAIALVYVPTSLITFVRERAGEPLVSHMLAGSLVMFGLALARFCSPLVPEAKRERAGSFAMTRPDAHFT